MNKKSYTNIILGIITVILVGGAGYFVFVQKSEAPSVVPAPASTTEETERPTANGLKKYTNSLLGIEFYYPKNFIPYLRDNEYLGDQPSRFTSGEDSYAPLGGNSYFVTDLTGDRDYYDCPSLEDPKMSYSGSYETIQKFIQEGKPIEFESCKEIIQNIDEIAENSAYHKLRPFGENPLINKLEIEEQEARLIIPSDPGNNETELIARLKNPVLIGDSYWTFLVIHVSRDLNGEVIKTISESLHFL